MARVALVHALVVATVLSVTKVGAAQAPGEAVTVVDPIDIPPEHDPLAHAWDLPNQRGGFYLRGFTSIGVQNTRIGPADWESDYGTTVSGFSSGYGLDIGGFLLPWLALHVDTSLGVLWSGDNEYELRTIDDYNYGPSTRVLAYGIAPAVTFFTPHRFFFKPAFGVGFATWQSGGQKETTDPGFYMHLVAGKDLYTDQHFSFGLQFEVGYMLLGSDKELEVAIMNNPLGVSNEELRVRQFLFGVSFGFDSI